MKLTQITKITHITKGVGGKVNPELKITLTATGTGAGVSTLRMQVSTDQTFTITAGTARFYTDAAGTLGESTTWAVTAGAIRTIYLKAPSGSSTLSIPDKSKVIKFGNTSNAGWDSSTNAASLTIDISKLVNLTDLRIVGNSTITGAFPTGLTSLSLIGNNVNWTYSGEFPTGLTYVNLSGTNINWTYSGELPTGLTYLNLYGNTINWTYSGELPTGLTLLGLSGANINWTYSGELPTGLTYLYLVGANINWTGLDVGNSGNIVTFSLINYRTSKMSSPDMVTLLTQMKNRTGTLPSTVTINDYADYASPTTDVVNAVAALKAAKSITTVNLGA